MRLKLLVAYDGRPFRGWQSQATGDGVQDLIERAAADICGEPVRMHGAGRTDAGVHALGQCAHFDPPGSCRLSEENWLRALNASLPVEIRVMRVRRVRQDFHARFDAKGKHYRYTVCNGSVLAPFEVGRAWHVPGVLDRSALSDALRLYEGTHDFSSFSARRRPVDRDATRTIRRAEARWKAGGRIEMNFIGDGFLYKMVRILTACAVRVALGKESLGRLQEMLENPEPTQARHVAPAGGLCLLRVWY